MWLSRPSQCGMSSALATVNRPSRRIGIPPCAQRCAAAVPMPRYSPIAFQPFSVTGGSEGFAFCRFRIGAPILTLVIVSPNTGQPSTRLQFTAT